MVFKNKKQRSPKIFMKKDSETWLLHTFQYWKHKQPRIVKKLFAKAKLTGDRDDQL